MTLIPRNAIPQPFSGGGESTAYLAPFPDWAVSGPSSRDRATGDSTRMAMAGKLTVAMTRGSTGCRVPADRGLTVIGSAAGGCCVLLPYGLLQGAGDRPDRIGQGLQPA